ncbi:Small integral membrane protein 19 [Holothuria leucospilota]|uniref:Small integral membrane protein 19 n=1 Tax=Holothuria leucospilota TaxID=206669 RepID=A0A9Q0YN19_HOLLE|nr:Small integral membrane protein 19 [Holothuria leucospilota]
MAKENNGLPPEVHIDHWNEATNIYMVVVCVSLWFLYYFKRNGGRIVRMITRQNEPVAPEVASNKYKDELKHIRLRQQLEHYYKVRKWDEGGQEHRIEME